MEATDDIVFCPPPPKAPRQSQMSLIFDKLRAAPGEWARIRTGANKNTLSSYAGNIKSGLHRGNRKGDFETEIGPVPQDEWIVVTVETDDGPTEVPVETWGVWARYVGHLETTPEAVPEA